MPAPSELVRPWRGLSPEQRIAERRERLLDAALEVFATQTFHLSTVRDVCRAAGLTERYLYESFDDKESLLLALAERIVADFIAAAGPGLALAGSDLDATIEQAVGAAVHSLTDDPRRARILFIEIVGVSPRLEDKRREVIGSLVDVLRQVVDASAAGSAAESVEVELVARAVIGAAAEVLVAYARQELPIDQDELVLNLRRLMQHARPVVEAIVADRNTPKKRSTS